MGPAAAAPGRSPVTGRWPLLAAVALVALIVGLRVVALTSDPYPRLDWSAGQLTDEGFYVHNARNVALFGHARTDEFNNMLLAPLLHYVQVGVFHLAGVGSAQARSISAVSSLLMLALLWAALRRAFDTRVAWTAVVVLGLDHVTLLYHRMALMDTPAAAAAVAAFYAFVRGAQADTRRARWAWFVACGALVGVTVTNRMLCAYLVPAPFAALVVGRRAAWRDAAVTLAAMAAVFVVYGAAWYWPNRAEIGVMTGYYRTEQIQPKSPGHLAQNVFHAALGDFRGESPYLFRHTPVVFGLALAWLAAGVIRWRRPGAAGVTATDSAPGRAALAYLVAWMLCGAAILAVIGYSPSRYYVSVYPALAALAAIALWRLPDVLGVLFDGGGWARGLRAALAWFLAYHAVEALVHHGGRGAAVALYGIPTLVALAAWWPWTWRPRAEAARRLVPALAVAWVLVNGLWLADWARTMAWTQYGTSRWLAANLPPGSVVLGDVAPGLCLDNRFVAVNVIPRLCNDALPVERYAGHPRCVAILDGRWKESFWRTHYADLVHPARRIKLAQVLRWYVGIYPVPEGLAASPGSYAARRSALNP